MNGRVIVRYLKGKSGKSYKFTMHLRNDIIPSNIKAVCILASNSFKCETNEIGETVIEGKHHPILVGNTETMGHRPSMYLAKNGIDDIKGTMCLFVLEVNSKKEMEDITQDLIHLSHPSYLLSSPKEE